MSEKWTQFMDMHSGGGQKLDWPYIYINASEDEARRVFWARFGRHPDNVTCGCCGADYSVSESDSLQEATAYNRNLRTLEGNLDERTRTWRYADDGRDNPYLEPTEEIPAGGVVRLGWDGKERERGMELDAYVATAKAKFIYDAEITEAERASSKGSYRAPAWSEVSDE